MIARTASGAIVDRGRGVSRQAGTPAQPIQWEARDEWGRTVPAHGRDLDTEFPLPQKFRAVDAIAAAELAVERLVDRYQLDAGPTVVSVRPWPNGEWVRVQVEVELTVSVEVRAERVIG